MLSVLKEKYPIARKEHRCMYCGGVIPKGEKYLRQTCCYDGQIYDWIAHERCVDLVRELDIEPYDEGIGENEFDDAVSEYVFEHHFNDEKDDIEEEWANLTTAECVPLILAELKQKNGTDK